MSSEDEAASSEKPSFPAAAMQRLVKASLASDSTSMTPDAVALLSRCTAEFVRLLSSEAASGAAKKTIQPDHISAALDSLGFAAYCELLPEEEDVPKKVDNSITALTSYWWICTVVSHHATPSTT